jgi:hypothetical protein
MRSVKVPRKKAPARASKAKEAPLLSTSEARANFAEALETAQVDNAIIGFGRYGRTVAALVPVEAIYMLAGMSRDIDVNTRREIEKGAASFAESVPYRARGAKRIVKATAKPKPRPRRARAAKAALAKTGSIRKTSVGKSSGPGRKSGG